MTAGPPPFERVLELHGRAVLRFCIARAGAEQGEDCFQETMLAALRAYGTVRDPDAILGWLLSIAARKSVDAFRARARTPTPVDDLEALMPAGELVTQDAAVWGHVRELPPKQRQAVTLRFLGDLTHDEIAGVMQTSSAAARRNLFEGLRRLRSELYDAPAYADSGSRRGGDAGRQAGRAAHGRRTSGA